MPQRVDPGYNAPLSLPNLGPAASVPLSGCLKLNCGTSSGLSKTADDEANEVSDDETLAEERRKAGAVPVADFRTCTSDQLRFHHASCIEGLSLDCMWEFAPLIVLL